MTVAFDTAAPLGGRAIRRAGAVALLALVAATGFAAEGAQGPPPPAVTVRTVTEQAVPITYEIIGTTEASRTVEIRSRIDGFLEQRLFEEGGVVKEGQVLYEIDRRSYDADVEIARARVSETEARLELAQREADRIMPLADEGVVAQGDVDRVLSELNVARASLRTAKAELAKAELELSYTTIASPLTGLIDRALREVGSYVEDGGENGLLAVVTQVDPIYAEFSVSEREYIEYYRDTSTGRLVLEKGANAPRFELVLLDGTVYPADGTLNYEATQVDQATGTYKLRASFPNPDMQLRPGQFVRARILGWMRPGSLIVPQEAVSISVNGPYVYTVDDENHAQLRPLKLGRTIGGGILVEDGLKAGDRVIVEGKIKVQPGVVVTPSEAQPATQVADAAPAAKH